MQGTRCWRAQRLGAASRQILAVYRQSCLPSVRRPCRPGRGPGSGHAFHPLFLPCRLLTLSHHECHDHSGCDSCVDEMEAAKPACWCQAGYRASSRGGLAALVEDNVVPADAPLLERAVHWGLGSAVEAADRHQRDRLARPWRRREPASRQPRAESRVTFSGPDRSVGDGFSDEQN